MKSGLLFAVLWALCAWASSASAQLSSAPPDRAPPQTLDPAMEPDSGLEPDLALEPDPAPVADHALGVAPEGSGEEDAPPTPQVAESDATPGGAMSEDTAPPAAESTEDDGAQVTASLIDGVRLSVPEAAGFTFEAHLATWVRFVVDVPDGQEVASYFDVPLVRPLLAASVFDGMLRLLVQPEIAGPSPRLLDLQLDFVPDPAIGIRVGQFRTPYSRAYITPIIKLSMPDRGIVSDSFRADRDTGLMVYGHVGDAFDYSVGVFDGAGIDGRLGDTAVPMVAGRVAVRPYGAVPYDQAPSASGGSPRGLEIGVGGFYRDRDVAPQGDPPTIQQSANVGADVSIVEGPFAFYSEGFYREQSLDGAGWIGSFGLFAQAGVFVVPQILELSARGGLIDLNTRADDGYVQSYEGAIKGYFVFDDQPYGHHLCLGVRYAFFDTPSPYGGLGVGSTHRLTAQLQVWM